LQGKFAKARVSLGRFLTNTVLGCAGIMDVATAFKLEYNGEDFGQTLAHHKAPSGPYLVAPIIGPTSVRDISGKVVDFFIDPFKYALTKRDRNIVSALNVVHKRSAVNQVVKTINNSLDPYETAKILYTQNRAASINN
jgi:phospholipid-binding lipoprotein MlaA